MPSVCLRTITQKNFRECVDLKVAAEQESFVASNVYSLAQAKVNPQMTPLAIYDGTAYGREPDEFGPMVGFTMYEVIDGVGFIVRLMVGESFQRRGYGCAAMIEVIRRLKMMPEVEYIGTSFVEENEAAERLYRNLGFVDADIADEKETYVRLEWDPR